MTNDTRREVEALWAATFGGPPSVEAEPQLLLEVLLRHLPASPPYAPAPPTQGPRGSSRLTRVPGGATASDA